MFDTVIDMRSGFARVSPPFPVAPVREYRAPSYVVVHVWTPTGYKAPPPVLTVSAALWGDA